MAAVPMLSRLCLGLVAALIALSVAAPTAHAVSSAVIIMYHRVGEPSLPSTNVRLDQFEAHLQELESGGYTVLPVPDIVAALRSGKPLPERTVGITFDDGYLSVYTHAKPRLSEAGFPFTVFVSTDSVDRGYKNFMTWEQIRELAAAGVTIGSHSAAHDPMADDDTAHSRADLERANARFREELGSTPTLFAYPFGEYSLALERVVKEVGFAAAFGQQSGVAFAGWDVYALPRFSFNETYGDIDRFRLVVNALPLPVSDITPADPLLTPAENPPPFGFTVTEDVDDLDRLSCFASSEGRARLERLGANRVEVRLDEPLPPGRSRINCTMLASDDRWRWFGVQFVVPE